MPPSGLSFILAQPSACPTVPVNSHVSHQSVMRTRATPRSAAIVGATAGLLLYFAGPVIDAPDSAGSVWLVLCTVAIGVPAYFFVLGIPGHKRKGLWVLNAPLLRRVGACLLAAGVLLTLAWTGSSINHFIQIDRCLDGGGRWNYQELRCEQ